MSRLLSTKRFICIVVCAVASVLTGCGSGKMTSAGAPVTLNGPSDQSVPLGLTATFSASPSFSKGLSFQWFKDGSEIPGATSAVYTTPAVAFSDNGSTFYVVASDSAGPVTSQTAHLAVTARAPLANDLRFQQVDALSTLDGYSLEQTDAQGPGFGQYYGQAAAFPVTVCNVVCPFRFDVAQPLTGQLSTTGALLGDYQQFFSEDIQGQGRLAATCPSMSNIVINSLTLSSDNSDFAVTCNYSSGNDTYIQFSNTVAAADFPAVAAQEAAQGHVVTAVSPDYNGNIFYFAYSWSQDPASVYETSVVTTTLENAPSAFTALANQGYILTANGACQGIDAIVLVGTRLQGDTMARPAMVVDTANGGSLASLLAGYSIVSEVQVYDGDNLTHFYLLGER